MWQFCRLPPVPDLDKAPWLLLGFSCLLSVAEELPPLLLGVKQEMVQKVVKTQKVIGFDEEKCNCNICLTLV